MKWKQQVVYTYRVLGSHMSEEQDSKKRPHSGTPTSLEKADHKSRTYESTPKERRPVRLCSKNREDRQEVKKIAV